MNGINQMKQSLDTVRRIFHPIAINCEFHKREMNYGAAKSTNQ